jgi:UDP-N-acetylbacillosamine N-acetyltransferase
MDGTFIPLLIQLVKLSNSEGRGIDDLRDLGFRACLLDIPQRGVYDLFFEAEIFRRRIRIIRLMSTDREMGVTGQEKDEVVIIWGASGHALVVADILRLQKKYQLAGFLDTINPVEAGATREGLPVYGGIEQLDALYEAGIHNLIFGFGDCKARLRLSELVLSKGFNLATAIHPQAVVAAGVQIQPGVVIAAGAVINPGSVIGKNAIINTAASVDHECMLGEAVHISPGVRLAGKVTVGSGTWVGIGAIVIDHCTIGAGSMIGAGALVVNDIPDGVLAYGVPARVIRKLT